MAQNKFKAYLLSRTWSGELGDFVRDARADDTFPDARSWGELRAYLEGCHAVEGAMQAGERLWNCYVAEAGH